VYSEQGGGIRIYLDPVGALLFYAVASGIVGASQWLVLRRWITGSGRWVLVVMLAGTLFAIFNLIVDGGPTTPAVALNGAVILGGFLGAISGVPLVWWLRSRAEVDRR